MLPEIAHYANAFIPLVADPEMQAMVAAAPQVGRILRPFCHMLGLPLPEWLRLPKRVRVRRKRTPASAEQTGQLDSGLRRNDAWEAREREQKPVDVGKLSPVAYGDLIHPECEAHPVGWRPPNRIGYARSRWPPKNRE